jgi:hypothetical protein
MKRLLSVDWDFFFPLPPHSSTESLHYDWGHGECELLESMFVWAARATGFLHCGKELPKCEGWREFSKRFSFTPGARSWIMEHHCMLAEVINRYWHGDDPDYAGGRVIEIVSYDAHHDCGYRQGTLLSTDSTKVTVTSENWAGIAAQFFDVRVEVIYPQWRKACNEDKPQYQPASITYDDGGHDPIPFDGVALVRSGAWVPPWCDDQWMQFLDTWTRGNAPLEKVPLEQVAMAPRAGNAYLQQLAQSMNLGRVKLASEMDKAEAPSS